MPSVDEPDILAEVGAYYTDKIVTHGPNHRGVDWNSEESQVLRFTQLLKIVDTDEPYSITDYGCGYGALALFLLAKGANIQYRGVDVSPAMIEHARCNLAAYPQCVVSGDSLSVEKTDYTVASGIFSVRLGTPEEKWLSYCLGTVDALALSCSRGFSFNMLTAFSDRDRMRPDLYYADPHFIFDECRTRYSRKVALLHDYPLYEFTVLVRF